MLQHSFPDSLYTWYVVATWNCGNWYETVQRSRLKQAQTFKVESAAFSQLTLFFDYHEYSSGGTCPHILAFVFVLRSADMALASTLRCSGTTLLSEVTAAMRAADTAGATVADPISIYIAWFYLKKFLGKTSKILIIIITRNGKHSNELLSTMTSFICLPLNHPETLFLYTIPVKYKDFLLS